MQESDRADGNTVHWFITASLWRRAASIDHHLEVPYVLDDDALSSFLPYRTFLPSLRDRNQEDVKSFGEARLIDQAGEIPSIILTSSRNIVHVLPVLLSSRKAKLTENACSSGVAENSRLGNRGPRDLK